MEKTDYERIGGAAGLEAIVSAFVAQFFSDFIIGFLFQGRDRERIILHEMSLASSHLGGPHLYRGRPLTEVHRPLKINKGHFRRRLAIVRHTLAEHGVPEDVAARWLDFEARLEPSITTDRDCVD